MQIRPLLLACIMAPIAAGANAPVQAMHHAAVHGKFEENKGQVRTPAGNRAPFVRYRLSQGNTNIFLLGNGIAYQFNRFHYPEGYDLLASEAHRDPARRQELDTLQKDVCLETYRMDMLLESANPAPRITTEGKSADYTHYYTHDALDVHTYTKVTYHDVWPGIDWVVYTTEKGMKYDFVLHPGANPDMIRLRFKDHEELYVDTKGNLVHGNRMGQFIEERPVAYQDGKVIEAQFLMDGSALRFDLGLYDISRKLIIDPNRVWGTYYGGTSADRGNSCVVDSSGNIYMAGQTASPSSIADGGHQIMYGGADWDAFLVKFDSEGSRLWGTYYGGPGTDVGYSCATASSGIIYLAGYTYSTTGISSQGHQNNHGGGDHDAFLVKFDSNGNRQWATYYGGSDWDYGNACAVDLSGNVYLAGDCRSNSNIASGGYQNTHGGEQDAFLVKFSSSGTRLWGTYFGGPDVDFASSCSVNPNGEVCIAGRAYSISGIANGGHQNNHGGGSWDAFLAKFSPDGSQLWSTYYGGSGWDIGLSCATDLNGNIYMSGNTTSESGIASGGYQNTYDFGHFDAFLAKFSPEGVRIWGTYFGGLSRDYGISCAIDLLGNVYLSGITESISSIAFDGHQNDYGGGPSDSFLAKFNAECTLVWATYYGGSSTDESGSCAAGANGTVYLTGWTNSTSGIASDGLQNSFGGVHDAFLVQFESGGVGVLEETNQGRIQVIPNPTTGQIIITFTQQDQPRQFSFFEATGRLVLSQPIANTSGLVTVDLSGHESGVYFVQVRFADGTRVVERVVKE